jgi:hypothetical protein
MAYSGFEDLSDWLREPVFWYGVVAPVALLVIVTLYLFWLDRRAARMYRLEVKGKNRRPHHKSTREKFR